VPIDLHKLNIGSSIWYQGKECVIIMLRKRRVDHYKAAINPPTVQWTISLLDVHSYQEDFLYLKKTPNRTHEYKYTGEVEWDVIEGECVASNAIDFIREPL